MYRILVVLTVAAHLAFIGYVATGGFLALRRRRGIWLHVPAVAWGILIVVAHLDCPLTWLESRARARAGMAPLPPDGFVAHYLTGVVYPAGWATAVQLTVLALVVLSWGLYVRQGRRYRGRCAGADHR